MPAWLKPVSGRMPMPAATIASHSGFGQQADRTHCTRLLVRRVGHLARTRGSRHRRSPQQLKQSQWPKCPARLGFQPTAFRPSSAPQASSSSPISPFFHSCPDNTSNVVSFQLRQAAFQQLDQQIIEAPSRPKRIEPLFGPVRLPAASARTRDGAATTSSSHHRDATAPSSSSRLSEPVQAAYVDIHLAIRTLEDRLAHVVAISARIQQCCKGRQARPTPAAASAASTTRLTRRTLSAAHRLSGIGPTSFRKLASIC